MGMGSRKDFWTDKIAGELLFRSNFLRFPGWAWCWLPSYFFN